MSGVASQARSVSTHQHALSSHRPAAVEPRQPSTPFAALLDSGDTQPPAPTDRSDRPQSGATSAAADKSAKQDNQGKDNASATDRSNASDTQSPSAAGNADQAAAADPTKADAKASEAKASETKAGEATATDLGDDKTARSDDNAAATDASAVAQPVVTQQTVAPVVVVAASTAGAAAADAKAAAANAGDAVTAPVGAAGSVEAGAGEIAAADAKANAGEIKGQTGRKSAGASNGAAGASPGDAKSADAKPADAKEAASTDDSDTPAPAAAATDTAGEHKLDADAKFAVKGEAAHVNSTHPTSDKDAAKTETPSGPQIDAQAGADKPAADAAQITPQQQHPNDRTLAPAAAAQTAATANNPITVPVAGLAVEIAARAQAGSNRFEIRLDPPELGRIEVRLDVDHDGNVSSRLTVEKSETLDLLRRDAPQLERALQQAGLKTGDSGLQFMLRDQSFAGQNQSSPDQRSSAAQIVVPDPEMPSVDAVQAGYGRALRLGGGIDIRV